MIPLSLYIHVPWCIRKCPYCDFNSHKSPDVLPEDAYITALLDDLRQDLMRFPGRPLASIFIGGGTPSLLSAKAYEQLLIGVKALLSFKQDIEITLEANPGTVDEARFSEYHALGINRLSIGIQSFNSTHLQRLGRIHDGVQAHSAIERARRAGFNNINLDIMHGFPGQTVAEGLEDLRQALGHQPEHLSWYQLTIEPNTIFYKQRPTLPDEEALGELEESGFALLDEHHFRRYEISAFCRNEKVAQHNINYWLFGDYLGIGAGAHGKVTTDAIYRTRKHRQPKDYLDAAKPFLAECIQVQPSDQLLEFMLNTTRLQQPIPYTLLSQRTDITWSDVASIFQQAADKGFITLFPDSWQVTAFGRRYTNDVQALFLLD
jgi:putative oxygen-independent coproporphyrinogen III oxidase